jgi:DUF2075 family protein
MIVYSATKRQFHDDIFGNAIEDIIHAAYRAKTGRSASKSEVRSWANSLEHVDRVLKTNDIAADACVAVEYHIPGTSNRIDFLIAGRDSNKEESVVIIELKQWELVGVTTKDALVTTRFQNGQVETVHPSYQAWSYKRLLEDFSSTVEEDAINLHPCAYLHNYSPDDLISNDHYEEYIGYAPLFLKPDAYLLQDFIKERIQYGDDSRILERIDNGKLRPSKALADSLAKMLKGNPEFVLIDNQKVVFETAVSMAMTASPTNKKTLIVHGGPGTGKSVIAIHLLVRLSEREHNVRYVSRNSAPRKVYEAKLARTEKRSRINEMFYGSGKFYKAGASDFDSLIVDEAHRLTEKSGMYYKGVNQIKEIIHASNFSVFFLDEDQRVTMNDIGDAASIREFAETAGAEVIELRLESQFRCNGSDGYLAWLDDALQIRPTANTTLSDIEYDFRIFDDPATLHALITEKNSRRNKARMVAGYCWQWISQNHPEKKDIQIGDYAATWNLASYGQAWIIQPDSVSEIGCIHASQGLAVDYVGVIVGPDLVVRDGKVITDPSKRAKGDKSISGWKKRSKEDAIATAVQTDLIIKNTYRTLMTRGQKGCYVYFVDPETREYFKSRLKPSDG